MSGEWQRQGRPGRKEAAKQQRLASLLIAQLPPATASISYRNNGRLCNFNSAAQLMLSRIPDGTMLHFEEPPGPHGAHFSAAAALMRLLASTCAARTSGASHPVLEPGPLLAALSLFDTAAGKAGVVACRSVDSKELPPLRLLEEGGMPGTSETLTHMLRVVRAAAGLLQLWGLPAALAAALPAPVELWCEGGIADLADAASALFKGSRPPEVIIGSVGTEHFGRPPQNPAELATSSLLHLGARLPVGGASFELNALALGTIGHSQVVASLSSAAPVVLNDAAVSLLPSRDLSQLLLGGKMLQIVILKRVAEAQQGSYSGSSTSSGSSASSSGSSSGSSASSASSACTASTASSSGSSGSSGSTEG
jgi:hypothetical protein